MSDLINETLISGATVRLFGRIFNGMKLETVTPALLLPTQPQRLLANQLDPTRDPRLARIYGFSYEGKYYSMSVPAVFLVHGPGTPVPPGLAFNLDSLRPVVARAPVQEGGVPPTVPEATGPTPSVGITGTEITETGFASDIVMWPYSDVDYSIRIEVCTGQLLDILLAEELGEGDDMGEGSGGRGPIVGRSKAAARSAMAARSKVNAR